MSEGRKPPSQPPPWKSEEWVAFFKAIEPYADKYLQFIRERGEEDHTEVEMLLESYHKVCDEIVQNSGNLVSNIRNTEEM